MHDVHHIGIHFITSGTLGLVGSDRADARDSGGIIFTLNNGNSNDSPSRNNSNDNSKNSNRRGPNKNKIAPSPSMWGPGGDPT